jgi:hypothetical protein
MVPYIGSTSAPLRGWEFSQPYFLPFNVRGKESAHSHVTPLHRLLGWDPQMYFTLQWNENVFYFVLASARGPLQTRVPRYRMGRTPCIDTDVTR